MNDKKTILQICPPTKGGIGKVITDISIGLGDTYRFLAIGDVPQQFPNANEIKPTMSFPNSIHSLLKFKNALEFLFEKEPIDLIHVHGLKGALLLGYCMKLIKIPPVIYSVHNHFDIKYLSTLTSYLEDLSVKKFISIVTVSDVLYHHYCSRFKKSGLPNIHYVCNGINIETYVNLPVKKLESHIKILNIGRLVSHKGQDILLESAAIIKKQYNLPIEITIAGEGPWREFLITLARNLEILDIVHFVGHSNDIPNLLRECDIFVLPSRSEGMPLSILEAMAAGKPVVASAIGGIPYIIQDGCGVLVPPEDPQYLVEGILKAVKEIHKGEMGHRARERILNDFSLEKMLSNYGAIYTNILGDKKID